MAITTPTTFPWVSQSGPPLLPKLMAASVSTSLQFAVTGRAELFKDDYLLAVAPHANYDVSLDGGRFLMVKPTTQVELSVVYGWLDEVRAKLAAAR